MTKTGVTIAELKGAALTSTWMARFGSHSGLKSSRGRSSWTKKGEDGGNVEGGASGGEGVGGVVVTECVSCPRRAVSCSEVCDEKEMEMLRRGME